LSHIRSHPQLSAFLVATTLVALYIWFTPDPGNNWVMDPLTGIVTVATGLLVGVRLALGTPSRLGRRLWAASFVLLTVIGIYQLFAPLGVDFSRYLEVEDLGNFLLLFAAPLLLWATSRFEPLPIAARRVLWMAFLCQLLGAAMDILERVPGAVDDQIAWSLRDDLVDFVTMQFYLVAATLAARPLTRLLWTSNYKHYYLDPSLGLHGKHSPEDRLASLEAVIAEAPGATVLDLGCAEGVISAEFIHAGARRVDGFDINPGRVAAARRLLSSRRAHYRVGNLNNWSAFVRDNELVPQYDIVLFLGVYQHLAPETRIDTLQGIASKCRDRLAVRAPLALLGEITEVLNEEGFDATNALSGTGPDVGHMRLYLKRRTARSDA
jgi:hypothetical protein